MSTTQDLMGLGMPPALAGRLGNNPVNLTGFGTSQVGAAAMPRGIILATPTGGNTAFVLDSKTSTGALVFFWNQSSSVTALVFPPSGATINGGSANASVSIPPLSGAVFQLNNGSGVAAENWGCNFGGTSANTANPTLSSLTVTGVITPTGGEAAAGGFSNPTSWASGNAPATSTTQGSSVTPTITVAYFCEVFIPVNTTVTGLSLFNAAAVAGNIQLGLYSSAGALLASTASTAQAGTAAYQQVALTAPYTAVGPAKYYILAMFSSASGAFRAHTLGNFTTGSLAAQTFGTLPPTITPPTTFTTAVGPVASTY